MVIIPLQNNVDLHLKLFLQSWQQLPEYMLPSYAMKLSMRFHSTPNGKLDKNHCLKPTFIQSERHVAPSSEHEHKISRDSARDSDCHAG
ncbi:hypothetical protein KCP69_26710 (plasmid) [Salmonella enterica subsp. enterica]|nr:hypothetical protein KCP69_26710 [Salmonella enterica subsp. enterica]